MERWCFSVPANTRSGLRACCVSRAFALRRPMLGHSEGRGVGEGRLATWGHARTGHEVAELPSGECSFVDVGLRWAPFGGLRDNQDLVVHSRSSRRRECARDRRFGTERGEGSADVRKDHSRKPMPRLAQWATARNVVRKRALVEADAPVADRTEGGGVGGLPPGRRCRSGSRGTGGRWRRCGRRDRQRSRGRAGRTTCRRRIDRATNAP